MAALQLFLTSEAFEEISVCWDAEQEGVDGCWDAPQQVISSGVVVEEIDGCWDAPQLVISSGVVVEEIDGCWDSPQLVIRWPAFSSTLSCVRGVNASLGGHPYTVLPWRAWAG